MSTSTERMRAHRARRAKSLEPGEHVLRHPDDMLEPALAQTLAALDLGGEHAAAVQLAMRYARVIDRAEDVAWAARWIGPLLLDCLTALGATPAAKAALDKGSKTAPQGPNRLDQLRAARASGKRPGIL